MMSSDFTQSSVSTTLTFMLIFVLASPTFRQKCLSDLLIDYVLYVELEVIREISYYPLITDQVCPTVPYCYNVLSATETN